MGDCVVGRSESTDDRGENACSGERALKRDGEWDFLGRSIIVGMLNGGDEVDECSRKISLSLVECYTAFTLGEGRVWCCGT